MVIVNLQVRLFCGGEGCGWFEMVAKLLVFIIAGEVRTKWNGMILKLNAGRDKDGEVELVMR